jgi:hypothetical protein
MYYCQRLCHLSFWPLKASICRVKERGSVMYGQHTHAPACACAVRRTII